MMLIYQKEKMPLELKHILRKRGDVFGYILYDLFFLFLITLH